MAASGMNSQAARRAAADRALKVVSRSAADVGGGYVWNFGFGANINPWKLQEKRGIRPAEAVCGKVPGWRLLFNHRGGFGNIEEVAAADAPRSLSPSVPQPAEVHGILLKLTHEDFGVLAGMEHQYDAKEVVVRAYDGRAVTALAFITNGRHETVKRGLLPTARYINLIRKGAEQMGIEPSYCKWLQQIPSVPDNSRDADYYDTGSGRRPSRDRPSSQGARPGGSPARERRRPDSAKRPRSPARQTPQSAGGDAPRGAESGGPGRGRQGRTRGAADRFTVFSEPGSGPAGLCVRGNGLYVSDHKSDSVKLVSLEGPEGGAAVVAGGNGKGRRPEQLSRPWRLFVDAHGGVFVVDRNNARVQRWGPDGRVVTVAGGHGAGPELWQLDQPVDVHVLAGGEVYVSDRGNHRVVLWPPGASQGRVVAGGRGFGRGLDQLACPGGLQVTGTGVIYVADEANNRVMRWRPDGDAGQVVAGGQGAGGGTAQLYHPLGLWVSDEEDCLVVADSLGYRVQRFVLSAQTPDSSAEPQVPVAETIAGGEPGSAAGQLGQPMTVQVADDGALFVADSDNARVQRYDASEQARAVERTRRENRPLTERNELRTGHCTEYNARSGYGFVRDDGGLKYFAHHSDIIDPTVRSGYPTLSKGDPVAFEARRDAKWKWRGTNIVKTAP